MVLTNEQLVVEALDPTDWVEGERPYLCVTPDAAYTYLPDTDVLAFVTALPVGCVVLVPEELDEVMFTKTEHGWVPSY